ncbi:hydrogenase maturation protease [Dehalococcoides mccartyi]|jgi:coenzyme F420 hydrogenase subunit delta|uniref:Hydrogenase maturation protease n=1 Tax=Dehalococcoides mccartyi (strain CBDB1) TaxID=255470 RepID=A0A916KM44_DEHMC|nr:hydrogenase maturation protease [Dehalococcoides mccartyi]AGG07681.1 hydrogen maturation protease, FrhD type [Dehalococcoides mccartyi BTF08]AQW62245.1 hydrogenase maturation protease [Dehalococcoides mccartyi]AQX73049.1 hydrogenase maturation protease [Dehalococcoides mccartyi]AQX74426.1 hydrogenase maturation protease [Dehalococcoides mccartyi]AQY73003.1 hydrogenase maturation protease [Dehalococcoides mccartyi]
MDYLPEYCSRPVVVFGCGNILYGDDGFGPAVADYLNTHSRVPSFACVMDVGTAIRELLFNIIISDTKPKVIVLVDAMETGLGVGEMGLLTVDQVSPEKINDFSLHLMPTLNMLKELHADGGVRIDVLAVKPEYIPPEMEQGLTGKVQKAVAETARYIVDTYFSQPLL